MGGRGDMSTWPGALQGQTSGAASLRTLFLENPETAAPPECRGAPVLPPENSQIIPLHSQGYKNAEATSRALVIGQSLHGWSHI